jgi:hypothetical protein
LAGILQGGAIQAVLLEILPESHLGDPKSPGTPEEGEQLIACGLGMGEEKLGDGPGMARQKLPIRATAEVLLDLLSHLLGGELPMAERRADTDADQARDLSHLQSHTATVQKMTGDPRSGIVPVAPSKELKSCLKHGPLLIAQPFRPHPRPLQPLFERLIFRGHAPASPTVVPCPEP